MFGKAKKPKNPDRIGVGRFWAWGSREVSETSNILLLTYVMLYCTDTLHLDGAIVGMLLAASKIVDAITDMVAGYVVDKTKTRFGKGRPYELCIFGTWICTYLMFVCPDSWGDVPKYIWVVAFYTMVSALFNTFLNAGEGVYMVRAFKDGQIVRLSSFTGFISNLTGFIVNIVAPQLVKGFVTEKTMAGGWGALIMCFAIPVTIVGLMRFIFIKEEYEYDTAVKTEDITFGHMKTMFQNNKYIWFVLAFLFLGQLGSQLGIGSHYMIAVFGDVGMSSMVSAASILVMPMVFFFPKLVKKMGLRQLMILGTALNVIGSVIAFISNTNIVLYIVGFFFIALGSLPTTYLIRVMVFNCAAYNEWKGMARMEGTMSAMQGFARRMGAAFSTALGGLILSLVNYDAEAITSSVTLGLRIGNCIPGVITSIISLIILRFYALDKMMPQINAENEARRAAQKSETVSDPS